MLQVQTFVADSDIHGYGLFAKDDIPKGTVIWRYTPGQDHMIPQRIVDRLNGEERMDFLAHATYDPDSKHYLVYGDNMRFLNHSDMPNTVDVLGVEKAFCDIKAGEEITCSYPRYRRRLFPKP